MHEVEIGDLVVMKAEPRFSRHGSIHCLVYSRDNGACKIYNPLEESIRTTFVERLLLINKCEH